MSIVSISPIFAEPVDVEIDWTIEGQLKTIENPSAEESVETLSKPIDSNWRAMVEVSEKFNLQPKV